MYKVSREINFDTSSPQLDEGLIKNLLYIF